MFNTVLKLKKKYEMENLAYYDIWDLSPPTVKGYKNTVWITEDISYLPLNYLQIHNIPTNQVHDFLQIHH